jgi:hypothetical protein
VKQGLILEYKAETSMYLNELDVRKPLVESISTRSDDELRLYNLVYEFDNFEAQLKSGTLKCISWLYGSFSESDDWGFLKKK